MRTARIFLVGSALVTLHAAPADARLERIRIDSVTPAPATAPIPYEIVRGRFFGALDPADTHNRIITDIAGAPRDRHGRVAYSATFAIARPVDPSKASGVLFYDVPNRGGWPIGADPDGHVRVISGWQGDLAPGPDVQSIAVPVAHARNGGTLTGPALARFTDTSRVVIIDDQDRYVGIVQTASAFAKGVSPTEAVGALAIHRERVQEPDAGIKAVMSAFDAAGADEMAIVAGNGNVLGILSESCVLRRYAEELDKSQRKMFRED